MVAHAARSAASMSAELALPSNWRGIGVGTHGFSAAAGGGGIRTGKGGKVRIEPAHAVSAKAASPASIGLSIFPHGVGGVDNDRLARGHPVGERHRRRRLPFCETALLVGASAIGAIHLGRPSEPLVVQRLLNVVTLGAEEQRRRDRRHQQRCRAEPTQQRERGGGRHERLLYSARASNEGHAFATPG